MDRRLRASQPAALPLEGRILPARGMYRSCRPPPKASQPPWARCGSKGRAQDAEALAAQSQPEFRGDHAGGRSARRRSDRMVGAASHQDGTLQVQVATDPSSPAVGVNLPAVNQTATFAARGDQTVTSVTIPTTAGAPNPGEVDVNLTITPIDPPTGVTVQGGPLELRILAPMRRLRQGSLAWLAPRCHRAHVQQADEPCPGFQSA